MVDHRDVVATDRTAAIEVSDLEPSQLRKRRRWSAALKRVVPAAVVGFIGLGIIELIVLEEWVSPLVFPRPSHVGVEMFRQVQTAHLWENMWVTLQEGLWGFAIGSAIGFILGVGIGLSRTVSRAIYPYIILVQSMPRVALAPVFVAILGFGMGAKTVTAVAICFFPLLINTVVGLRQVGENELMLLRSIGASKRQTFWKLLLPNATPMIFGGLKTNMTLALLGAIVGELTAANAGIGMLIEAAAFQLRMPAVIGYIMWLSLVSLVLFGVLEIAERRVVFWKEDVKREVFAE